VRSIPPHSYVRVTARPTPVLDGGPVDADFPLAEALPFDMDSEPAAARDPILANGLNGCKAYCLENMASSAKLPLGLM